MNSPPWAVLIGILLLGIETRCKENPNFTNTELRKGLFYEKLTPFQNIAGTWRVKVVLGTLKSEKFLITFSGMLQMALTYCVNSAQFRCHERINYARLQKRLEMATKTRQKLAEATEELKQYSKSPGATDPPQNFRKRRQTPDFSPIGNSKVEAGDNLTDDEREMGKIAADDEALLARNLTFMLGEHTHVINSALDRLNQLEPEIVAELESLNEKLNDPSRNSSRELHEYMVYQHLNLILDQVSMALEFSIEEYIKYLEVMIHVAHSMQQRKVHPYLLNKKQLSSTIEEIQKLNTGLDFPMPKSQINVYDVIRISSVSFNMENDNLIANLDIPLLEKTVYYLYQLHSVHIIQKILNNGKGRAFIVPRTKFLAMDIQKKYYFHLKENILRDCHPIAGKYICHIANAYYNFKEVKSCEMELLKNTSVESLRDCNIRVSFKQEPLWTAVVSLGGWLYSLTKPETAYVYCAAKGPNKIILRDSGFLQLAPGCVLNTKSVTLPAMVVRENYEDIYDPAAHLNLSEISTILRNYYNNHENPIFACPRNESDCSLLELENQRTMVNEDYKRDSLTLITFWCLIIFAVIFILHILRSYCCHNARGMYKMNQTITIGEADDSAVTEQFIKVDKNERIEKQEVEVEGNNLRVKTEFFPTKKKGQTVAV